MKTQLLAMAVALGLSGCASSPYTYHVEPTPLVAGQSKYVLGNVDVKLTEHFPREAPVDNPYINEDELTHEFVKALQKHMAEQNILASSVDSADGEININVDFQRNHSIYSGALAKPAISHTIEIVKDSAKLATTASRGQYTTKYAYFQDTLVNAEISVGTWDEEDEPKDVDLISDLIVQEVAEVGK